MKKTILIAIIFCSTSVSLFAQQEHSGHHETTTVATINANSNANLSRLLAFYYNLKDALVAGNAQTASAHAEDFVKTANSIDYKVISEGNLNALLKDATIISATKDIKKQREAFTNLSTNMFAVAKAVKLTSAPIYYDYCPMKKAYWLSSSKEIKNPYYGSAMLTCGKITETVQFKP